MSDLQDQIRTAEKAVSERPSEMAYLSTDDLCEAASLEVLEQSCYCQAEKPSIFDLCTSCLVGRMKEKIEQLEHDLDEARNIAELWRGGRLYREEESFPWEATTPEGEK